jgi:toxin YoeB
MSRVRVCFTPNAWEEYTTLLLQDRALVKRINQLIEAISRDPFSGIGKPEPLKHQLAGYWSRRINEEHRLVYRMEGETLTIVQCRYHY